MLGLWLENQSLSLRASLPASPMPGEALLRVRLAGICGTDLEMLHGYYPFTGVLGHEFVGEVVSVPHPEHNAWIGKRVVGEINVTCGDCTQCHAGRSVHCERRSVLGVLNHAGVFAEYASLPLANLYPVPDSVPDEAAVFTEPLAAALEISQQVHLRPNERVLLVGAGRLGQLIAQTLRLTGVDLHVLARHSHQQNLLRSMGIEPVSEAHIQPRTYDVVIEATGSPDGFALARSALRPRGKLVLKSTYRGSLQINLSPLVVDEITLLGSRCGPFAPALRLLEQGLVQPQMLIQAEYPLAQGLQAFESAAERGAMKIVLRCHPSD
ncbi:MAG: alcohol dehydrogenase [Desulfobulbaceae bacterium A2]|nr:MAG: alcohol dehydrogenase [Desulfobulbaceae bacterium A2]